LKSYDTKEALCRALAMITGYTDIFQQRSVLSGSEGFITYVMITRERMYNTNQGYQTLKRFFAP
jgi:hypothetical protein